MGETLFLDEQLMEIFSSLSLEIIFRLKKFNRILFLFNNTLFYCGQKGLDVGSIIWVLSLNKSFDHIWCCFYEMGFQKIYLLMLLVLKSVIGI